MAGLHDAAETPAVEGEDHATIIDLSVARGDAARPETVGETLLRARRATGEAIDDVVAATKIKRAHIEALEASDFAALPATPFAAGFVKVYAGHLGLDAPALVRRYKEEVADAAPPVAEAPHKGFAPGVSMISGETRFASLLGVLAVGLFAVWMLVQILRDPDATDRTPPAPAALAEAVEPAQPQPSAPSPGQFDGTAGESAFMQEAPVPPTPAPQGTPAPEASVADAQSEDDGAARSTISVDFQPVVPSLKPDVSRVAPVLDDGPTSAFAPRNPSEMQRTDASDAQGRDAATPSAQAAVEAISPSAGGLESADPSDDASNIARGSNAAPASEGLGSDDDASALRVDEIGAIAPQDLAALDPASPDRAARGAASDTPSPAATAPARLSTAFAPQSLDEDLELSMRAAGPTVLTAASTSSASAAIPDAPAEPVVAPAKMLRRPELNYPDHCRRSASETEEIVFVFDVDMDGRTTNISVASSTNRCFDRAGVKTIERMRFSPKTVNGAAEVETGRTATLVYPR